MRILPFLRMLAFLVTGLLLVVHTGFGADWLSVVDRTGIYKICSPEIEEALRSIPDETLRNTLKTERAVPDGEKSYKRIDTILYVLLVCRSQSNIEDINVTVTRWNDANNPSAIVHHILESRNDREFQNCVITFLEGAVKERTQPYTWTPPNAERLNWQPLDRIRTSLSILKHQKASVPMQLVNAVEEFLRRPEFKSDKALSACIFQLSALKKIQAKEFDKH